MSLKTVIVKALCSLVMTLLMSGVAFAAFNSGSNNSLGAFSPSGNTSVTLPDDGVLNYTTINIPSGVTVTFIKNGNNTPVTLLASGDVTISGTISVDAMGGSSYIAGEGGPGGYDGGIGGSALNAGQKGCGPGSGSGGAPFSGNTFGGGGGGGGGYASSGTAAPNYASATGGSGGSSYGNSQILPLIGGSGGGGGGGSQIYFGGGGGGGGGAIVIASSGTITLNGNAIISANGGRCGESQNTSAGGGGGGAGGSVRLIANTVTGAGNIYVKGGSVGSNGPLGGAGSNGRIRIDCTSYSLTLGSGSTLPISTGTPSYVVPPNLPTLSITSIGGIPVPSTVKGSTTTPDIVLPANTTSPVTVTVQATNVPALTNVTLSAVPVNGSVTTASATLDATLSASIPLSFSTSYPSIITASLTYTITASSGGPIYADGERVDKIRVAANLDGSSTTTYITVSGREIPVAL